MKPDSLKMVCFALGVLLPFLVLSDLLKPFFEWSLAVLVMNFIIGVFVTHKFKGGSARIRQLSGLDEKESALIFMKKGFYTFNTLFFWFIPTFNTKK